MPLSHSPLTDTVSSGASLSIRATPLGFSHIPHVITCNPWIKKAKGKPPDLKTHLDAVTAWVWTIPKGIIPSDDFTDNTWHSIAKSKKRSPETKCRKWGNRSYIAPGASVVNPALEYKQHQQVGWWGLELTQEMSLKWIPSCFFSSDTIHLEQESEGSSRYAGKISRKRQKYWGSNINRKLSRARSTNQPQQFHN